MLHTLHHVAADGGDPLIRPACPRCQRREAIVTAYADDLIAADARIGDLEGERDTYRDLAVVGFDTVRRLTQQSDHWRAAYYQLRDQRDMLLLELVLRSLPPYEVTP